MLIADLGNNAVRKVSAGGTITTIAGNGTAGYFGDGALATTAQLSDPIGIGADLAGNVYIADYSNSRIRMIVAKPNASFTSAATMLCEDSCTTLTNTTTGVLDSMRWEVSGVLVPITTSGPIPLCFPVAGSYTVNLYVYNLSGSDTASVPVTVVTAPVPILSHTGHTLSVAGTYASYQWLNSAGPIPGATLSTFTTTGPNIYSVMVSNAAGCNGVSAGYSTLGSVDLTQEPDHIVIQPNPTNGTFVLKGTLNSPGEEMVYADISDLLGKTVQTESLIVQNGIIDVSMTVNDHVPNGIYILSVKSGSENLLTTRLSLQR